MESGTQQRKLEHLNICINEKVEKGTTFFEFVTVEKKESVDVDDVDLETKFLGKKLSMPLLISSMTGGISEAEKINKDLAAAAEEKGIAFAVGSQRAMIEEPNLTKTYQVRDVAPNILFLGNIGMAQVKQYDPKKIIEAVKKIRADALFVHYNPLQELAQAEGDKDFSGWFDALEKLCNLADFPIIGKEVGCGINHEVAEKFKSAGAKAVDVAGSGGSDWVVVEGLRHSKKVDELRNPCIPTAKSLVDVKKVGIPVIASGGIRTGSDIAKALAMGADICGIALPFLRAWSKGGKNSVIKYIEEKENELKTSMAELGYKNVQELKKAKYILGEQLQN